MLTGELGLEAATATRPRVVEVAIDAAGGGGARTYTYTLPEHLADVAPGEPVLVEFGRRQALAVVLGDAAAPAGIELKPVAARVRSDGPLLPPLSIGLARWIADHYLALRHPALRDLAHPQMVVASIVQHLLELEGRLAHGLDELGHEHHTEGAGPDIGRDEAVRAEALALGCEVEVDAPARHEPRAQAPHHAPVVGEILHHAHERDGVVALRGLVGEEVLIEHLGIEVLAAAQRFAELLLVLR